MFNESVVGPRDHYADELDKFVKLMRRELERNRGKGAWTGSPTDALHEIAHHYTKLAEANRSQSMNVGELAADIANCAFFYALAVDALDEPEQGSYY